MTLTRQQLRELGRAQIATIVNFNARGPRRERRKLARALHKKEWDKRDKKMIARIKAKTIEDYAKNNATYKT